jgi:hypothetical protein
MNFFFDLFIFYCTCSLDFINNRVERSLGMDLNGDGYIGGQGTMLKYNL